MNEPKIIEPKYEWVSKAHAAGVIDVSTDTIERRAVPWQDEPVKFRVRYKILPLDENDKVERPRFFRPDVEAFLKEPRKSPIGGKPKNFARKGL